MYVVCTCRTYVQNEGKGKEPFAQGYCRALGKLFGFDNLKIGLLKDQHLNISCCQLCHLRNVLL